MGFSTSVKPRRRNGKRTDSPSASDEILQQFVAASIGKNDVEKKWVTAENLTLEKTVTEIATDLEANLKGLGFSWWIRADSTSNVHEILMCRRVLRSWQWWWGFVELRWPEGQCVPPDCCRVLHFDNVGLGYLDWWTWRHQSVMFTTGTTGSHRLPGQSCLQLPQYTYSCPLLSCHGMPVSVTSLVVAVL